MADNVEDKLNEAALGPKRVKGDAGEVEQPDLDQLIKVDKYQRSKGSLRAGIGHIGLTAKIVPPGSI